HSAAVSSGYPVLLPPAQEPHVPGGHEPGGGEVGGSGGGSPSQRDREHEVRDVAVQVHNLGRQGLAHYLHVDGRRNRVGLGDVAGGPQELQGGGSVRGVVPVGD